MPRPARTHPTRSAPLTGIQRAQALFEQGVALHQVGRRDEACERYREALRCAPQHPQALHFLGVAAYEAGRPVEAIDLIGRAITVSPDTASFHCNLGNALHKSGRLEEAERSHARAAALKPDFAEAHYNRGNVLREMGQTEAALGCYDRAATLKPDFAGAHFNRANALLALGQAERALASYEQAAALRPRDPDIRFNQANALRALSRDRDALAAYDAALALAPELAPAHVNRATLLADLGRHDEAIAACDRAIAARPTLPEAHFNRGKLLKDRQQWAEALASLERALALRPDYPAAHITQGTVLRALRRAQDALKVFDAAIALEPGNADAHNNRGNALADLRQYSLAVAAYDEALRLRPDYAAALSNQGNVLRDLRRMEEASRCYDRSLELDPRQDFLAGTALHARMKLCQWDGFDVRLGALLDGVGRGQRVSMAFPLLALVDDPAVHRRAAGICMETLHPARAGAVPATPRAPGRIRLGYYSADLHNHATAWLMAELFEAHDRQAFELFAFSFGPNHDDEMRQRVARAFDHFIDVGGHSDDEVIALSRSLGIDIAIDLKGLTQDGRPGIFSGRSAPVQVSYLGYPGTMGTAALDYVIGDRWVTPVGCEAFYSEKIVRLPGSYQVNDSQRRIAPEAPSRAEAGLPEAGFVFCCFNNNYKILPDTFAGWMRILQAADASVLWLFEDNPGARGNLQKHAARLGVDPRRLVFAGRMPQPAHLARHRLANLCLDTLPYNAHTTASDALWAGVPMLTLPGRTFASRVGASLLGALGLDELIAPTQADFEQRAIGLARDPAQLTRLKAALEARKQSGSLFDARAFARPFEAALNMMARRHLAGLPPAHLDVDAYGSVRCDEGSP